MTQLFGWKSGNKFVPLTYSNYQSDIVCLFVLMQGW